MGKQDRPELGAFCSAACMASLQRNVVKCGGSAILMQAGIGRGRELVEQLGVKTGAIPDDVVTKMLNDALGSEGTRLCIVEKVEQSPDRVVVHTRETACSYLEQEGSERECLFTMGALTGFFQHVTGKRIRPRQAESALRGASHDVFELMIMD